MNETEKENVKEAEEEEEEEEIWVREQRKIKRKRSRRRRRREEQLADRLDLAPASDGGQRQRQRQRAEVRGQTSVIFLLFFHCWRVGAASEPFGAVSKPCRRSEKKKKKRHSPDTGIRRVVPVPVSDTDTTPKMACLCNLAQPHSLFIFFTNFFFLIFMESPIYFQNQRKLENINGTLREDY